MNEEQKQELKKITAEIKKTHRYMSRSAKSLRNNTRKLKRLEKAREQLLTPALPGIFD